MSTSNAEIVVEPIQAEKVVTENHDEGVNAGSSKDSGSPDGNGAFSEWIPTVAIVHATATFEKSPFQSFSNEEWDSLLRCIVDKDHLKRNVVDVQCCGTSSRQAFEGFKHTVEVLIKVKTEALWESPRSYLWRHLGQDGWTRGNGTKISLTRIHQK